MTSTPDRAGRDGGATDTIDAVGSEHRVPDPGPATVPLARLGPAVRRHRTVPGTALPSSSDRTEPLPRVRARGGAPDFATASGYLPVPDEEGPTAPEHPAPQRTKVTLTAAPGDFRLPHGDDTRIYLAPSAGLDSFDLGSVPASVTPPRTWRRAAWFASMASGAAVLSMLFVGTALVGEPADGTDGTRALQGWPETEGPRLPIPGAPSDGAATRPAIDDTATASRPQDQPSRSAEAFAAPQRDGNSGNADGAAAPPDSEPGSNPAPPENAPATTAPAKPPVSPARTDAAPVVLWAPHDTDVLAQRSQDYLNTVTEDPVTAHAMTTGDLAAEGADGLADRYSEVAYFEVREVYVDANEGYTVNTVEVTYVDGTTERQTRTLDFGEDDRIEADSV
ncbi:hypothetical protein FFT09_10830 [Saccharomonospora piscinae]|uniref:hypothetical protein n=1 Tax=Saccharomonospora piscinae TaxID=687388 RepID=UPI0011070808|nr:hypothetical protein [Saccharomonospora piscinae]TLW93842.1 hypothetical protein FFT09_10830 [Saccharomonospora piscinae]